MVTTNIPFNIPLFTLGSVYSTYASGAEQMAETNNSNIIEYNMVKNTNWPKTNQLAIYKRGRRYELVTTVNLTVNQSSKRSERDLNSEPLNCKSSALTTRPRCLLRFDP